MNGRIGRKKTMTCGGSWGWNGGEGGAVQDQPEYVSRRQVREE